LITISETPKNEAKIRGLGYIGLMAYGLWLMAYGDHHQRHHWAMATGKSPHKMQ